MKRQHASERRLQAHGLTPVPLPGRACPPDARPRNGIEIARRAIAVHLTASRAEGTDAETISALAAHFDVTDVATPSELLVLLSPAPLTPEVAQRFQWRHEACWVLLWILGHIDELAFPDRTSDPARASKIITEAGSASALVVTGEARHWEQVVDEADFTLRLHAVCTSTIEAERRPPQGVIYPVVHQRTAAFQWALVSDDRGWSYDRFDP